MFELDTDSSVCENIKGISCADSKNDRTVQKKVVYNNGLRQSYKLDKNSVFEVN